MLRAVLGDEIFLRLHPDWRESQAESVRSACTNEERDVFVAVVDAQPVGFVAVALNAFHDRMGAIEIIGVDPDYQRTGVGATLTKVALDHMRDHDMDIAVVETGGDPGHAPAQRALHHERVHRSTGRTLLPFPAVTGRSVRRHPRSLAAARMCANSLSRRQVRRGARRPDGLNAAVWTWPPATRPHRHDHREGGGVGHRDAPTRRVGGRAKSLWIVLAGG